MKQTMWRLTAAAAVLAAPLSTARAELYLTSFQEISGSGLGTVTTVLTIQHNPIEEGCIGINGILGASAVMAPAGTDVSASGGCTGTAGNDVKPGQAHTGSYTVSELGISDATNYGIILNGAEPNDQLTVNSLTASFYNTSGTLLFQANLDQPYTLLPANGTGNSGYLFQLTPDEAAALNATGFFTNPDNVYGLASNIGCSSTVSATCQPSAGGQETFFIANVPGAPSPVPEPSSYALIGTGLAGLLTVARRRRA